MRQFWRVLGATALLSTLTIVPTDAAFYSMPRQLKKHIEHIAFDRPALQPMAHTMFCLRHTEECKPSRIRFRPKLFALDAARWRELVEINREVNRAIEPKVYPAAILRDTWTLNPQSGDCNDYAITKRHRLMARGWPSYALLLAVVKTSGGEGHLVLVARTHDGDFVLDNLRHEIKPWSKTRYEWVQIQSPRNPQFWTRVNSRPKTMLASAMHFGDRRSEPAPDPATLQ